MPFGVQSERWGVPSAVGCSRMMWHTWKFLGIPHVVRCRKYGAGGIATRVDVCVELQ